MKKVKIVKNIQNLRPSFLIILFSLKEIGQGWVELVHNMFMPEWRMTQYYNTSCQNTYKNEKLSPLVLNPNNNNS